VPWFDFPPTRLLGIRSFAFSMKGQISGALIQSFILLFFLFMLRVILRKDWLATLGLWALVALPLSLTHESPAGVPFALLGAFLWVWSLYRYGLLATASATFFMHLNIFFPITSEFSAWYAGDFVLALIVSLALACYGFYTSLAGQRVFRSGLLED
jgi:hypothetical protein